MIRIYNSAKGVMEGIWCIWPPQGINLNRP
jgi:hypothetical protein